MLSAKHRFHGHNSVRGLYRSGKTAHAKGLRLTYMPSASNTPFRVMVVVSKKVHKSAVVRNRIRRRVYEQLRLKLAANTTFDLSVQVYDVGFALAPATQLAATIDDLLGKAKLI